MDSDNVCLFHNDKLAFQQLCREIQHAKLIPRPYVHRVGMSICSCRRKKPDLQSLLQSSDLHTIVSSVQEKLHCNNEQKFLKNFLKSELVKGISTNNYSLCMLLYVLYQSYQNNTYELLQGTRPAIERPPKAKGEKPDKQKVREMAVRKRMKTLQSKQECNVKIFPGNLMQLKETEGYKKLIYEYRMDIVLKFNKGANERTFANRTAITHVIIHYADLQKLASFKSRLMSAAGDIQEKMDRTRKERRFVRRRIYNKENDENFMDLTTAACTVKETRQIDFGKKKRSCSTPPTPSPLIGGQCYNCLGTFEGLKNSGSCQHHPGFLKNEVLTTWTCCGEKAKKTKPCHEDHQETGCVVSIHNWRQRKNSGRKSDSTNRWTAAEDYKLSRACVKPDFRHRTTGRHVERMWNETARGGNR